MVAIFVDYVEDAIVNYIMKNMKEKEEVLLNI